ncbi:hypothetical protein psal_cds_107 [Pandoravirus salinus]|uniref:Uncharacterized protein n=1 Tax=Pandoravirus salinus TaxID=1349410 RepID=S4VVV5_9VIRU|nr:hypothetical protein psal_cds_107 [Pandoravirus salinus]AGO83546.1 hypothetical protein psal_cds_107 [Pandoravirus salinus]
MHRASRIAAARHSSHRAWKADLAWACTNYRYRLGEAPTQMTENGACPEARQASCACDVVSDPLQQHQQQQPTETTTIVTGRCEASSESLFGLFMSATTAGAMLGIESHPVAAAIFGASCGAFVINLLEIPYVKRTSVTTRPVPFE